MLKERGLLQYSAAGKCYVTGELVANTNTCLMAMEYGVDAYVDAGAISNSWMHLVMSDPTLVRLSVEIELDMKRRFDAIDATTLPRRPRRGRDNFVARR